MTEDLSKLDPEVQEAYSKSATIVLSSATVASIRAGGGVSVAAAIPDDVEVVDVNSDGVEGKLYKLKGGEEAAPCLVWFHVSGNGLHRICDYNDRE
jgi:hypothetical protein